jgi:hypothetical protein
MAIREERFVLRLEKMMFRVLNELRRFLNWHVLRLASKLLAARAFCSPGGGW